MNVRSTKQAGFTIIELVVVIVILGILAATALPKFVDMSAEAKTAAAKGVGGAAASASALNYAGCLVTNNTVTANKCVQVRNCTEAVTLLQGGVLPTGYTVDASASNTTTNGTSFTCNLNALKADNVTVDVDNAAVFSAIAAGNP